MPKRRKNLVGAWKWKWAIFLLHAGMITMVMALLIAGYEQSQIERAIEGSTWTIGPLTAVSIGCRRAFFPFCCRTPVLTSLKIGLDTA
jgi:hypothetical protein